MYFRVVAREEKSILKCKVDQIRISYLKSDFSIKFYQSKHKKGVFFKYINFLVFYDKMCYYEVGMKTNYAQ